MIVDKRRYSSWQKIYATYEGNMAKYVYTARRLFNFL